MNKNIYLKWTMPLLIALLMGSCISNNLNDNPTASTSMDPNIQLTTVQLLHSTNADDWHRYLIYPGGFMNHWTNDWATINYGGAGQKNDSYFAHFWGVYYPVIIREAVDLVERTRDVEKYTNVHAAAKVAKVEHFLRLTDFYGDIPYFDAGKAYYSGVFKPAYNKQEDIYKDFFKELKEAVELFDPSGDVVTGDIYFNGNTERWIKYANSLRLRIAMRLIKVDKTWAETEAKLAIEAGVMASNDDICYIQHDNQQAEFESSSNGIGNRMLLDKSSTFRISRELVETMENTNDPRLRYYCGSYLEDGPRTEITDLLYNHYGSYSKIALPAQHYSWSYTNSVPAIVLNVNGADVEVSALLQYMQPSKLVSNPGAPYIRMSYAEVEFLIADALARNMNIGVGGDANSHYIAGLDAAVRQWTLFGASIDEDALTKFKADNKLQASNELNQINTQLWVLHFLDPFETWSNWRRSGLPVDQLKFHQYHSGNESDGQTPRRLQYPVAEQTSNPEGLKEAVDRMNGVDSWIGRLWWDKK